MDSLSLRNLYVIDCSRRLDASHLAVDRFEQRLQSIVLGDTCHVYTFAQVLRNNGAVITGGIIDLLAHENPHQLERRDVDIWCRQRDYDRLIDDLVASCGAVHDTRGTHELVYTGLSTDHVQFERSVLFIGTWMIDVIAFNDERHAKKIVMEKCDIDVCRNYYNGHYLRLSRSFIDRIEYPREHDTRTARKERRLMSRMIKYQSRGYVFPQLNMA